MMKYDGAHLRAYRRAAAKLGFYIHLVAYLTVNPLLIFINYTTNPAYLWFLWPLFGWGIGLVFHWFAVFVAPKLLRRFVRRELDNDRLGE